MDYKTKNKQRGGTRTQIETRKWSCDVQNEGWFLFVKRVWWVLRDGGRLLYSRFVDVCFQGTTTRSAIAGGTSRPEHF